MKKVKIELMKGDITERDTDAIINTANNRLILGSGLGGAIKAKGGSTIVEECARYGTISIGDAVLTSGGNLRSSAVIHAALMEYDGQITKESIVQALFSSLRLANKQRFKSIAIPDLSIGIERFPPEECAEATFTVLREFIKKKNRTLELIEIVLWDIDTLRIYKKKYTEHFEQSRS